MGKNDKRTARLMTKLEPEVRDGFVKACWKEGSTAQAVTEDMIINYTELQKKESK